MGNILVIDDEPSVANLFSEMIKSLGHNPIIASNATEGLKLFKKNPVDITFVDIKLPGVSGVEFLKEVKKIDSKAIVVVITGYPSSETITETILHNGYSYLEKPITMEKLRIIIERGLKKKNENNSTS
ncbi:hypothetical protein DRQ09_00895 [candidate division KSB1 bacterium]|nr:MAG: hypothetical protein DRQ09_00895 [candidate division KSB1 bacterium]